VLMSRIPAEFRLVAACCRWPPSDAAREEVRRRAASSIDWSLFLSLVRRHRVEGLVHRALSDAGVETPPEIRAVLARAAAGIGMQNLRHAAESLKLKRQLEEEGIAFLFLKGVTLGALAYGNLGLKQAWDIDLLVAAEQAVAAAAVLDRAGYVRSLPTPDLSEEKFRSWMAHCKESLWTSSSDGTVVELHTALVDNIRMLPGVSARSEPLSVTISPGNALPTLREGELYSYLCVHGATHGWSRLKWLADVAALLGGKPPAETERLHRVAESLGAGRSSAQALLLSSELLSLPLPPQLRQELESDRATRWLAQLACGAMAGHGATELDDTMFGTVGINFAHFLMGRGLRYKLSELARKLSNAEDRVILPLPPYLRFLYPVLAAPLWIWRRRRVSRA
jgi:hypothetical protein